MEKISMTLIFIGGLMVLGGVGRMQTHVAGFFEGITISLVGFTLIVIAIFICNREKS